MLRGNLSTRPFYNEKLVTLAIWLVAALVAALTIFNVVRLVSLSSQRRQLNARIEQDRGEAAAILSRASAIQSAVSSTALTSLALATREANSLIDARTFSWTAFFGVLERTLPIDVRLLAVSPRVDNDVFQVSMLVVARDLTDVDAFIDALSATGAFYDVAPASQSATERGTYSATINASYLPARATAANTSSSSEGGVRR